MNSTDYASYKNKMSFPNHFSFLIIALAFCITACGDSSTNSNGNGNEDPPGGEEPAANEVWMEGNSFTPSSREVPEGTRVTWVNMSSMVHTVTSGTDGTHDGQFDSGDIAPGDDYSYTFTETGTYQYFCIPHVNQGMTGTITVTASENSDGY